MTLEKRYDDGLEEIWRIKREICAGYASVEDYFRSVLDDQDRARRQGVRFVRLPIARREKNMEFNKAIDRLETYEPAEGRPDDNCP